jgi:hypothetical protein
MHSSVATVTCHPLFVGGCPKLRVSVYTLDILVKVFIMSYREFEEVLGALLSIISDGCIQVTFRKGTRHKVSPDAGPYKKPANS